MLLLLLTAPGKIKSLNVTEDSHKITLNWTRPSGNDDCDISYGIDWRRAITNESRNHTDTEEEFCVIEGLDACVMYEVSVTAMIAKNLSSEAEVKNVTTLPDGKWQLICRSLAYTCTSSPSLSHFHTCGSTFA